MVLLQVLADQWWSGSGTRARNSHAMIMAQALQSQSRRQCRHLLSPWQFKRNFFQHMERKYTQHFAHAVFSIDIFFTLDKNVIWTNTFYTQNLFTNKRTFLGIQTGSWKGDTYADLHIHFFHTDTVLCFAQSASCTPLTLYKRRPVLCMDILWHDKSETWR